MNNEMIEAIAYNIFRKAILEKHNNVFYGKICEHLIRIEL